MKRTNRNSDIWNAIMAKKGEAFSVKEIAKVVKSPMRSAYNYVKLLRDNGFVEPAGVGLYKQSIKQLETPKFKRDGSLAGEDTRQILWRTMIMLKDFSIEHLVRSAEVDGIDIKEDYARIYSDDLANVGILLKIKRGRIPSYKLIRNLGGKAPIVQRIKAVYDPNSKRTFFGENENEIS